MSGNSPQLYVGYSDSLTLQFVCSLASEGRAKVLDGKHRMILYFAPEEKAEVSK